MLFAPIRIFLGSGLFLLLCGLLYSVVVASIMGEGLPVAGVMVSIFGLMLCMLGLIADQISQIRLNGFDSGYISDAFEVEDTDDEKRNIDAAE